MREELIFAVNHAAAVAAVNGMPARTRRICFTLFLHPHPGAMPLGQVLLLHQLSLQWDGMEMLSFVPLLMSA